MPLNIPYITIHIHRAILGGYFTEGEDTRLGVDDATLSREGIFVSNKSYSQRMSPLESYDAENLGMDRRVPGLPVLTNLDSALAWAKGGNPGRTYTKKARPAVVSSYVYSEEIAVGKVKLVKNDLNSRHDLELSVEDITEMLMQFGSQAFIGEFFLQGDDLRRVLTRERETIWRPKKMTSDGRVDPSRGWQKVRAGREPEDPSVRRRR